jgi:hypothetical protein
VLGGIGLAMVMTPASTDAMNTAPPRLRGEASGVMQTMRQVGGTIGLAVMGTVAASADTVVSGISAAYYVGAGAIAAGAVAGLLLLRRVSAADDSTAPPLEVPVTPGAHPALRAVAPERSRAVR